MIDNEFLAIKTLHSIDDHLRGKVNDPDPLPSILPGALQMTTTYGLVAGLLRERDSIRLQLDALELSRRSWMDEAKSLEKRIAIDTEIRKEHERISDVMCRGDIRLGTACGHCSRCERANAIETLAKTIYETWVTYAGYVPWVERGNSLKQDEARQIASRTFELALANQLEGGK